MSLDAGARFGVSSTCTLRSSTTIGDNSHSRTIRMPLIADGRKGREVVAVAEGSMLSILQMHLRHVIKGISGFEEEGRVMMDICIVFQRAC